MPRLNSYHLSAELWPAQEGAGVLLSGSEAKHLLGVLRAKPGDTLRLFDGAGRFGLFQIASVSGRSQAELTCLSCQVEPRVNAGLVLALGWNKSSRRDWLLEKSVELGALGMIFWQAARSQGEPPLVVKDSWREKSVQAAKQCGAVWLPELGVVSGGVDGLIRIATEYDGCYMLDEGAATDALPDPLRLATGRNLVAIGPEGGLEKHEVDRLARAGFQAVSLGPRPLRWETAALYCLGLAHHGARLR